MGEVERDDLAGLKNAQLEFIKVIILIYDLKEFLLSEYFSYIDMIIIPLFPAQATDVRRRWSAPASFKRDPVQP